MFKCLNLALLIAATNFLSGCKSVPRAISEHRSFSHFTGLTDFSKFSRAQNDKGELVWLSPEIKSRDMWDQLVLSWNAKALPETYLVVEARAIQPRHTTKFFSWGQWSPDDKAFPRGSVRNQKDADGDVRADTLSLNQTANAVQIRLTFGGTNGRLPELKFLGVFICNTRIKPDPLPANRAAWGKIIPTPERSQQSYPGGNGWCSPTSLSMALAHWGAESNRADWNLDAPEVAAGVADHNFKFLTGNWSFNTAFAGSLDGMRACVTRFSDISEDRKSVV